MSTIPMADEGFALSACDDGLTPPERLQRLAVALEAGQEWDEPPGEQPPAVAEAATRREDNRPRTSGWGKAATFLAILVAMTGAGGAIYNALISSAVRPDTATSATSAAVAPSAAAAVPPEAAAQAEAVGQSAPPPADLVQLPSPAVVTTAEAEDGVLPKRPSQPVATASVSSTESARNNARSDWAPPVTQRIDYPVTPAVAAVPPAAAGPRHGPTPRAASHAREPVQYNWLGGGGG